MSRSLVNAMSRAWVGVVNIYERSRELLLPEVACEGCGQIAQPNLDGVNHPGFGLLLHQASRVPLLSGEWRRATRGSTERSGGISGRSVRIRWTSFSEDENRPVRGSRTSG